MHVEVIKEGMKRQVASECNHAHLKKIVKYDVVRCKKNSVALSSIMNYIMF